MNSNNFNHSLTPAVLKELNDKIVVQLENEEPSDYAELRALLVQRDSTVKTLLNSLPDDEKKEFAKLELEINNTLKNVVQSLLETSKEDIIQFVRSKAAVKKYK